MRVLVCGSRTWPGTKRHYIASKLDVLHERQSIELVITGAARGVDTWADEIAERRGWDRVIVPANWKGHGKSAGPRRNRRMLTLEPDLVLAFRAHGESRGTDDMIAAARAAGVPVEIIPPSGAVPVDGGRAIA